MYLASNCVNEIVTLVSETHEQLSREKDLSPNNDKVNFLLGRLVNFVTLDHHSQDAKRALTVLNETGIVQKLRTLCQEAEFQLEKYYSSVITESQMITSSEA